MENELILASENIISNEDKHEAQIKVEYALGLKNLNEVAHDDLLKLKYKMNKNLKKIILMIHNFLFIFKILLTL